MSESKTLIKELTVGEIGTIKNRIAMLPMTRSRAPELNPNDLIAEYYTQRASAGLIVTEGVHISQEGRGWVDVPGIWNDEQMNLWKKTTDGVHAAGGTIVIQLWHQGRQSHNEFQPDGKAPLAPSAVKAAGQLAVPSGGPLEKVDFVEPTPMTTDQIKQTVQDFAEATRRAKEAGFDGVEIHGANGYLVDQFLQTKTNKRTDEYGGSVKNRSRFMNEVLDACIGAWSAGRVGIRLSPNGVFADMGSPEFREQFEDCVREIAERKIAYINVVDGVAFGAHSFGPLVTLAETKEYIEKIQGEKRVTKVMGGVGYTLESAEKAIVEGNGDIIGLGRQFISEPKVVEKYISGEELTPIYDAEYWWHRGYGATGYTVDPPSKATE